MVASPIPFVSTPSSPRLDMVPIGGIIIWSGAIVDIPAGYALCDGSGDTPDLEDRFVIGAGDTYDVDDDGGSETVQVGPGAETQVVPSSGVDVWTGNESTEESNLPPFYALAYIQRTT